MADPLVCRYCGQPITDAGPDRTPSSAWAARTPDGALAPCLPSAPGHAPADGPPMVLWLIYDDDRPDLRLQLIPSAAVTRTTSNLDTWTATARANAAAGLIDAAGQYVLRPVPPATDGISSVVP